YMSELDLLVVPSVVHTNGDRDGIPNVIMEALSMGMPVVATDVCGIGEVVRDGESGLLAPQRDSAALARAIRYMLENGEKALEMGKNGQKLVGEMFDAEKNAKELKKLYLEAFCHASKR
ncbi:MAG: glycosyltransferase family 4 protein, partial [Desulfovibrio sp.]|nr:glycosyltransferase family 4 protein [Desulfovibrio sp.]